MHVEVLDSGLLRIAQAATDPKAKIEALRAIRIEPSGRLVATDKVMLVVIEAACEPFEGRAIHVQPARRIPPGRSPAVLTEAGLRINDDLLEASFVDCQYPNYQAVLDRNGGEDVPRSNYVLEVGALHSLCQSLPTWPANTRVRLHHRAARSVNVDVGIPGVTVLLSLAGQDVH